MTGHAVDATLDYVLDGLIEYLELERELGARTVEFDRALLVAAPPRRVGAPADAAPPPRQNERPPSAVLRFAFLHHAALSPKAAEMMAKIVAALGETAESTPVLFTGPLPPARVCVVLGAFALKKWFPNRKGAPGQWFHLDDGRDVLITYSPEYFLRFATITPAVEKMKKDMWQSLKALMQRLRAQA